MIGREPLDLRGDGEEAGAYETNTSGLLGKLRSKYFGIYIEGSTRCSWLLLNFGLDFLIPGTWGPGSQL